MSSTRIQITVDVDDRGRLTERLVEDLPHDGPAPVPSCWPGLFAAIHSARLAAEKQKLFAVPSDPGGLPVTRSLTHRYDGSEVTMVLTLDPLPPLGDWKERIRQAYARSPHG